MAVVLANAHPSELRVRVNDLLTSMSSFPVLTHSLWSNYD